MGNKNIKILIVDSDQNDAALLQELLTETMKYDNPDIDLVSGFNEALDASQNKNYDLCILEYKLEKKDGLKLLEALRESGQMMPIVFVTAFGSEEIAVKALKAGAVDYFPKSSIVSTTIAKSIRAAIRMYKEIDISLGTYAF